MNHQSPHIQTYSEHSKHGHSLRPLAKIFLLVCVVTVEIVFLVYYMCWEDVITSGKTLLNIWVQDMFR